MRCLPTADGDRDGSYYYKNPSESKYFNDGRGNAYYRPPAPFDPEDGATCWDYRHQDGGKWSRMNGQEHGKDLEPYEDDLREPRDRVYGGDQDRAYYSDEAEDDVRLPPVPPQSPTSPPYWGRPPSPAPSPVDTKAGVMDHRDVIGGDWGPGEAEARGHDSIELAEGGEQGREDETAPGGLEGETEAEPGGCELDGGGDGGCDDGYDAGCDDGYDAGYDDGYADGGDGEDY